jgi:precorrin-3B synthase
MQAIIAVIPSTTTTAAAIEPAVIHPPAVFLGLDPRISSTEHTTAANGSGATRATFLGVGLPFGRIESADLDCLSSAATSAGVDELRLTPWRMILIPVPSPNVAHEITAALGTGPFILDAADSRRRLAICAGAPSCDRGTTPVLADGARLAAMLSPVPGTKTMLHLSGCEKGCAHPRRAPVTLVARDGRYDLVRDGTPSDTPAERGLTLDQAAARLTIILSHSVAAA